MIKIKITAVRRTVYEDLIEKYENPIEHACDIVIGQEFISLNGEKPCGFCDSAQFCKMFKKQFGFTPTEYRKNIR